MVASKSHASQCQVSWSGRQDSSMRTRVVYDGEASDMTTFIKVKVRNLETMINATPLG